MNEDRWEQEYGNASRPDLLGNDDRKRGDTEFITTSRDDYVWPVHYQGPYARRKKLLQRFLFNEIADKYIEEMTDMTNQETSEKSSTYKETFKGDGFDVRDILESADPEVMNKYPLYTDQAHSVYFDKIKNIKQKTVSNDPQAAFRKYSYFSKPFYAELEE